MFGGYCGNKTSSAKDGGVVSTKKPSNWLSREIPLNRRLLRRWYSVILKFKTVKSRNWAFPANYYVLRQHGIE
ncbi:hypothetical protein [Deefgea sp. CFH1-16]|uniref:hypothetical protein n=1 Tax=Deefgea sp. CFH1-16 TaxID=2675457 RepID=UPI0015F3B839|nr:hypothetical protein [Deefgea sp. CFH1-16]MBM5575773.1 hypothetical protein [Deefgea sp. CFH1-16]